MRNLIVALAFAAAVLFGGTFALKAEAAGTAGAAGTPVQVTKPIHQAACNGGGPHCPPGYTWVCGPYGNRCWCAPC
jgi:hypothetical protein